MKTGDKLIITSSVTKDVYVSRCILLIRYHMQIYALSLIYLPLLWWLETQLFLIKINDWKDFMFRNKKYRNTLTIYLNISKLKVLIEKTICRNARIQMVLSKNTVSQHRKQKIIFLALRKEKRYQYVKWLSSLGLFPPPCFQFYHGNWR